MERTRLIELRFTGGGPMDGREFGVPIERILHDSGARPRQRPSQPGPRLSLNAPGLTEPAAGRSRGSGS